MTSKPSTTNCPKLHAGNMHSLPPPDGVRCGKSGSSQARKYLKPVCLSEVQEETRNRRTLDVLRTMSNKIFPVVIALWFHLFPFRTEKLSTVAPMVLHTRGRVGRRHFHESSEFYKNSGLFFSFTVWECE